MEINVKKILAVISYSVTKKIEKNVLINRQLAVSPRNYSSFSLLSAPVSSVLELTTTPLFLSTSRIHVMLAATVSSEKII